MYAETYYSKKSLPLNPMRANFLKQIILLALTLSFVAHASAKEYSPRIVPKGWVDDYEFKRPLKSYLKEKYAKAKSLGKDAYVYIYSEKSINCRKVRKLMKRDKVKEAFSPAYMVMLDYSHLERNLDSSIKIDARKGSWQSIIINVNEDGTLGDHRAYPVLHLLYRDQLKGSKYQRVSSIRAKDSGYVNKNPFIREMSAFFNR